MERQPDETMELHGLKVDDYGRERAPAL